ncbi:flagellar hook protein FlgE [Wenzhouxiangella sp. AB-CW3]|uniref:flagellar hook protein FlgE n=1 Tax=Wenzhouxiangella sp. AB-CW3 TaxID=2771012 RepID=UPI00168B44E9|nr:flagellar hook protein FlgE [Wenzhouxiangella sp. AB-CW3]QOC21226.1 flagellar hook protein FlgE [Wenzhouxiangella sp. AB-CW3]
MPFQVSLSGLNAASSDLNVTANNVSNVNTTGFKRSRANFMELFATGLQSVSSNATGQGVRLASVDQQITQGNIDFTENNLDLAISGDGFFTLNDGGATTYTRAGAFGVDRNGFVVNATGARLQVYPEQGDEFNTGQLEDLRLITTDSAPQASSEVEAGLNLPADAIEPGVAFDPDDPDSYNHTRSVTIFDSLGTEHQATYYFRKTANDNEWEVHLQINDDPVGGAELIEFDGSGSLIDPPGGTLNFGIWTPPTGADDIDLDTDFSNTTQFGSAFTVNNLTQDGFASGRLIGVDISEEGVVFARFTNGQSDALGKVALTSFANPQGLEKIGDTAWAETFESGQALRGEARTGSFGVIQSGALESANVNLTEELVNMITAQRNFQANAQMISTADNITQTIINIR